MDTRQLTYFLAVVDHQGFTAASTALRITQPALSSTIKRLEKECGVLLLDRGPKGAHPTEAGRQLAQDARRILADLSSTRARMHSIAQGRRGRVSLSVAPAFTWHHLPHALGVLEHETPDVDIDLRDPTPSVTLRNLHDGVVDLGVLLTSDLPALRRIHGHDLTFEPCTQMPLVALLPATMHSLPPYVSLSELTDRPWLIPARYPGHPGLPELLATVWREHPTARPATVTEVSTLQTCMPLVAAGRGVALAPGHVSQVMSHRCTTRRIREPLPPLTAVVGHRSNEPLSPAAARVREVLLRQQTWEARPDPLGTRGNRGHPDAQDQTW